MELSNGHTPHVEPPDDDEREFEDIGYEALPMDGDADEQDPQYSALEDDAADEKTSESPSDLADAMMSALMAEYQAVLALESKGDDEVILESTRAEAKTSDRNEENAAGGHVEDKEGGSTTEDDNRDAKGEETTTDSCEPFALFPLSAAKDTQIQAAARSLELKYRPHWAERMTDAKLAAAVRRRQRNIR